MPDDETRTAADQPPQELQVEPETSIINASTTEGVTDMTQKKAKRVRKPKTDGPRTSRAKQVGAGRSLKSYRLVNGIPAGVRDPSIALTVLEAIKKHGPATRQVIRAELSRSFKEATLNSYLGQFQREKIVTTKAER